MYLWQKAAEETAQVSNVTAALSVNEKTAVDHDRGGLAVVLHAAYLAAEEYLVVLLAEGHGAERLARESGAAFLGRLPFDDQIEPALGDVDRLTKTAFARAVERVASRLVG